MADNPNYISWALLTVASLLIGLESCKTIRNNPNDIKYSPHYSLIATQPATRQSSDKLIRKF